MAAITEFDLEDLYYTSAIAVSSTVRTDPCLSAFEPAVPQPS